jgi:hypothetical protein
MSIFGEGVAETKEPEAIQEVDQEYKLEIRKVVKQDSKKGEPMMKVLFRVKDREATKLITEYYLAATDAQTEEINEMRRLAIKRFCKAFDIEPNQLTEENFENGDFEGKEAWAMLKYNPATDEYGDSNSVARWM